MGEHSRYIKIGQSALHYRKWGGGAKLLLAFHGYADSAELFAPLAGYLEKDYTLLSFDLPHHGKSDWGDTTTLSGQELGVMVNEMMIEYNSTKVSLVGYSLGGRLCLSLVEVMPGCIDRVVLLAPDGLKKDPYYYFFTRTKLGAGIFRNMLGRPEPYFRVMNMVKKLRLVHPSRYKFAMHYLGTADSRGFLLRVWPSLSAVMPEPKHVKKMISQNKIAIDIFMGAYDRVMPPKLAKAFMTGLETVQLHILEKGHRVLDNQTAAQIAAPLLK